MVTLADLQAELLLTEPSNPGTIIPLYDNDDADLHKFQVTYRALRRSIRLKEREMSLINAYLLGKFFDELESTYFISLYKNKTAIHYLRMAENVYDLFEFNPIQLLRTRRTTVQFIRKLSRPNVRKLRRQQIDIFAGAQN